MSIANSISGPDKTLAESSIANDGVSANQSRDPAGLLAPSDFLPGLPPSTQTPSLNAPRSDEDIADAEVPSKRLVDTQGRTLNPRSCVTCRKRKVKCDKL